MAHAFTFPGQGSQFVGMGRDLADNFAAARAVFDEVEDALGHKLTAIMFEGPEADLTLTENTQPALMAVSLAVVRTLESEFGVRVADRAALVAGHSLGEYSALAAAGALTLADTARLLQRRGQAMQRAVPVGEGAMAALLGLDLPDVVAVAEAASGSDAVCAVANDNAPGQVVISGQKVAVEQAIELAKEKGARRAILLPVSAPFHCPLMQPAADAMAEALAEVKIAAPIVPVVANVTASMVTDPEQIRALLVAQVTGMVRWRESVLYMGGEDIDTLVELGAGKVLSGLVRRINRDMAAVSVQTPAEMEAFARSL